MPRAAVPTPKKPAAKAPIPLRQKPPPLPNKSKGVKPSTPSSKSPTGDVPMRAARAIPKVKALTPAPNHDNNVAPAPSHDPNMALYRAHEALQRDYEALRHEHDVLLLKHNDSVHSCLLLLEELKERQPSAEPESMAVPPGRGRGKAPWKQPPADFDTSGRDALPAAGWQRHTWPQPDPRAPEDPEFALECPPSRFQRRGSDELDELCSEEEGEEEGEEEDEEGEMGHPYRGDYEQQPYGDADGGGGEYDDGEYYDGEYGDGEYADDGGYADDDDLVSRAEARGFLEELILQKQLVKDLQAQVGQLTADLSSKCEREGALVIHVSPELW